MKQPISFIYRNLVFGRDPDDVWAVYRLVPRSYAGLSGNDKRELLSTLAGFAYSVEADFSLLRVARRWSVEHYAIGVEATADIRHTRRETLDDYLSEQRLRLAERESHTPEIYASVRLPRAQAGFNLPALAALQPWRRLLGLSDARAISGRRMDDLLREEVKVQDRVLDYLDCEPASSAELQWLIRRAFVRGLDEPDLEERFLPQALVVEAPDEEGGLRYRPLEADVLRLFDAPINVEPRTLRVQSEQGDSWQAFLCLGALPEEVAFPGRHAELLFAPLEALEFPVDVSFNARVVPNAEAVRLIRRRIIDADNIFAEESHGDHGPSSNAAERPTAARELEEYLTGGDRPPLLQAGISLCVGAGDEDELDHRIERLRREYGSVKLYRPLGDQLRLFVTHLPGQGSQLSDYDDYLTVEQFGAMVPVATHAVGASVGPCIGSTMTGARQPVLFDPTEGCRTSRPPATLLAGTLGSGKTLCMELIMYQAFLAGSTICDIDPKGDHALERLPGVEDRMEVIELSPDERFRGLLDPLRVAPVETREDLACNFLFSILPLPIAPTWQTEVRMAVQAVVAAGGRTCGEVIAELERGSQDARDAARALTVHAGSGLARLGMGRPEYTPPEAGSKQITSLRIRNLTLAPAGTPRADMLDEERVGEAVLHLLAVYALGLTSIDTRRHSILGFDEAWVLLSDSAGRALVDRISRLGRSRNVTPLLATQVLGDVEELEGLIGAVFCFGVETEREAANALRLLHLDESASDLVQRLVSFRRGRCFMRDYEGRVSPMQVELDPLLLEALDTTPRAQGDDHDDGDDTPAAPPRLHAIDG